MRACLCPFSTLNISETMGRGSLLLGAYRKVGGQNRLVTSLMTSRGPAQQVPQPVDWGL